MEEDKLVQDILDVFESFMDGYYLERGSDPMSHFREEVKQVLHDHKVT